MINKMISCLAILISISSFAQETKTVDFQKEVNSLNEKIQSLQSENKRLKTEISSINSKVVIVNKKLDTIKLELVNI